MLTLILNPGNTMGATLIDTKNDIDMGEICLLTATDSGRACWLYVRVASDKHQEFQKQIQLGKMYISDYVEIIESDWGDYPPPEMIRYISQEYHFETPEKKA